jgi:uncharacterized protein YpuA (DUF1002 family)
MNQFQMITILIILQILILVKNAVNKQMNGLSWICQPILVSVETVSENLKQY